MTHTVHLEPHDPLPDAPAVVVMRRFDEDRPRETLIEIIRVHAHAAEPRRATDEDGTLLSWEAAIAAAGGQATEDGLDRVFTLDRTAGPREREIIAHGGDHGFESDKLSDEDETSGNDLRDRGNDGAPRRF